MYLGYRNTDFQPHSVFCLLMFFRYSIVEDNEEEPELPYYIDLFGYKVSIKANFKLYNLLFGISETQKTFNFNLILTARMPARKI